MVRTEASLAAALQDDIRVLVQAASEVAGFTGRVEFRAAEQLALPTPHAMRARIIADGAGGQPGRGRNLRRALRDRPAQPCADGC